MWAPTRPEVTCATIGGHFTELNFCLYSTQLCCMLHKTHGLCENPSCLVSPKDREEVVAPGVCVCVCAPSSSRAPQRRRYLDIFSGNCHWLLPLWPAIGWSCCGPRPQHQCCVEILIFYSFVQKLTSLIKKIWVVSLDSIPAVLSAMSSARNEWSPHLLCLNQCQHHLPSINSHWSLALSSDDVQCRIVIWLLTGRAYSAASLFPFCHYTIFSHRFVLRLHHCKPLGSVLWVLSGQYVVKETDPALVRPGGCTQGKVNFLFVIIAIINKSKLPSTSGRVCLHDSRLPSAGQMQEPPQVKIGVHVIKLMSETLSGKEQSSFLHTCARARTHIHYVCINKQKKEPAGYLITLLQIINPNPKVKEPEPQRKITPL